jgi:hypothetical protein
LNVSSVQKFIVLTTNQTGIKILSGFISRPQSSIIPSMASTKIIHALNSHRLQILILAIFILGASIRLVDATDEPLEFHPARQLRSAIIARSYYYKHNPAYSQEEIRFAISEAKQRGLIEPPILENLTVFTYRLIGSEQVWVGRLYSIFFWLLGGWALYALTKEFASLTGSIISLSLYFLLPFSIYATRVLMPDPLMVAFTVISICSLYRWEKKRTWLWAVFTGLATGFTIFAKSVAGIILIVPFAVFILSTVGLKTALKSAQTWLILLLSALPIAMFTYYGFFIDRRMAGQFIGRFFPNLYFSPSLYVNWITHIEEHFSLITLILSIVGLTLVKDKNLRWLLAGWWAGYLVYGFVFPHHITTHSYYHLPLVPIMAVSLAPLASRISDLVNQTSQKSLNWGLIIAAYLAFVAFNLWSIQDYLVSVDYRLVSERLEHIGAVIKTNSKTSTIALSNDYEASLQFYGMTSSRHWPSRGEIKTINSTGEPETFEALWERNTLGVHFFVILDVEEFYKQAELRDKLLNNYEIIAQEEEYFLFDLKTTK